jgi:hypothetical protein
LISPLSLGSDDDPVKQRPHHSLLSLPFPSLPFPRPLILFPAPAYRPLPVIPPSPGPQPIPRSWCLSNPDPPASNPATTTSVAASSRSGSNLAIAGTDAVEGYRDREGEQGTLPNFLVCYPATYPSCDPFPTPNATSSRTLVEASRQAILQARHHPYLLLIRPIPK